MLTAKDIRFARNVDLGTLTDVDSTVFAAWQNSRGISERNTKLIADRLGMDKYEFLKGLELRREDFAKAREVQGEVLFQNNNHDPETTTAIATQHPRSPHNTCAPEPVRDIASGSPHTIHTLQTLKTLSETEKRERDGETLSPEFRAWLIRKAQRLPSPPEFLERWIEVQAQRPSIREEFQSSQTPISGTSVPPPRPPQLFEVEAACLAAIQAGDRAWVRSKLEGLCLGGWGDLVRWVLLTFQRSQIKAQAKQRKLQ